MSLLLPFIIGSAAVWSAIVLIFGHGFGLIDDFHQSKHLVAAKRSRRRVHAH